MINTFNSFYTKTLKYELCNKFTYKNVNQIPRIKKIILNFGCKTTEIKQLTASLLALELIANQRGVITTTKSPNILLKIKKGNPSGCKITLRKTQMLHFLIKLVINIFPRVKNFSGFEVSKKPGNNTFSFELDETFAFNELEKNYYLFNKLKKLSVTVVADCSFQKELIFLLRSFQFPLITESKPQA